MPGKCSHHGALTGLSKGLSPSQDRNVTSLAAGVEAAVDPVLPRILCPVGWSQKLQVSKVQRNWGCGAGTTRIKSRLGALGQVRATCMWGPPHAARSLQQVSCPSTHGRTHCAWCKKRERCLLQLICVSIWIGDIPAPTVSVPSEGQPREVGAFMVFLQTVGKKFKWLTKIFLI